MPEVRRRQFGSSEAGKALTAALLDQGRGLCPPGLRGMPATTVRFYVGDDDGGLSRGAAVGLDQGALPPVGRPDAAHVGGAAAPALPRGALQTTSASGMLALAVRAERFGDRPAFEVPTSLAARWNFRPPTRPGAGSQ